MEIGPGFGGSWLNLGGQCAGAWGVAMEWRKETEVLVACAKKNQVGGNSGAVLSCGRKKGRRLDATLPFKNSGRFPPPPYVGKGRGKGGFPQKT